MKLQSNSLLLYTEQKQKHLFWLFYELIQKSKTFLCVSLYRVDIRLIAPMYFTLPTVKCLLKKERFVNPLPASVEIPLSDIC